jgi:uncharacterized membrane protein
MDLVAVVNHPLFLAALMALCVATVVLLVRDHIAEQRRLERRQRKAVELAYLRGQRSVQPEPLSEDE